MKVRGYYDKYWSDAGLYPHGKITPGLRRLLSRHATRAGRVLDVGCGDAGAVGPWFREMGWRYTGADVSPNAVKDAEAAGFEAVVVEDASDLPFEEDAFDFAVCLEVLEHLFAPDTALREVHRVLRPGALLIVTVPNVVYWRRRVDFALLGRWNPLGDEKAVTEPWRDPHIRFFNPGALRRLLRSTGFEVVEDGGHGGTLLGEIPKIGRRIRRADSSRPYRLLERLCPSLFVYRLHIVVRKPQP